MTALRVESSSSLSKGIASNTYKLLSDDFVPGDGDVICGRGSRCFNHSGNKKFRKLVEIHLDRYSKCSTKYEKTEVICEIIDQIRAESPNGGFVKMDAESGRYYEVGDLLAREKTSQAFRDSLQDQYKSSTATKKKKRLDNANRSRSESPLFERLPDRHKHTEAPPSQLSHQSFADERYSNFQWPEHGHSSITDTQWQEQGEKSLRSLNELFNSSLTNFQNGAHASASSFQTQDNKSLSNFYSLGHSSFSEFELAKDSRNSQLQNISLHASFSGFSSTNRNSKNSFNVVPNLQNQTNLLSIRANHHQERTSETDRSSWESNTKNTMDVDNEQHVQAIPSADLSASTLTNFTDVTNNATLHQVAYSNDLRIYGNRSCPNLGQDVTYESSEIHNTRNNNMLDYLDTLMETDEGDSTHQGSMMNLASIGSSIDIFDSNLFLTGRQKNDNIVPSPSVKSSNLSTNFKLQRLEAMISSDSTRRMELNENSGEMENSAVIPINLQRIRSCPNYTQRQRGNSITSEYDDYPLDAFHKESSSWKNEVLPLSPIKEIKSPLKNRRDIACGKINPLLGKVLGGRGDTRNTYQSFSRKKIIGNRCEDIVDKDQQFDSDAHMSSMLSVGNQSCPSLGYGSNNNTVQKYLETDLLATYFDEKDWDSIQSASLFDSPQKQLRLKSVAKMLPNTRSGKDDLISTSQNSCINQEKQVVNGIPNIPILDET